MAPQSGEAELIATLRPHDHRGNERTVIRLCVALLVLGILVSLCAVCFTSSLAAEPPSGCDFPLVPTTGSGSIELTGLVFTAKLSCQDAQCSVDVEQTYHLHNKDGARAANLRLSLPVEAQAELAQMPGLALRNDQGGTIAPLTADAPRNAAWEVALDRGADKIVVLAYTHVIPKSDILHWCAELPFLSTWGVVESARIEFRLPQYTASDALLRVEPQETTFDGQTIFWQYEQPGGWPRHEALCISPDTWRELLRLGASGAHYERARLLMALQDAAGREKVAGLDLFPEIVAELQAALAANPGESPVRLDLAQVYRARAEARPELRLNYLLLAAQELALVLEQRPGDAQVAEALSLAYYNAATVASDTGDPGGALTYLRKARATGAQTGQDSSKAEDLTLRWALSLAEQGRVSQAMAELAGVLSPEMESALLRYAPPLTSAHTEVRLGPSERVARMSMQLFPPSAARVQAHLQEIASRLNTLHGCQAILELDTDVATLELHVHFRSLAELKQRASGLVELLAVDADLLSALVSAPFQADLQAYAVERGYWRDQYAYREQIDLRPLQEVWETESQYVRWRMVELRNTSPTNERAQLEQRFALLALRDQLQIWEALPAGTYWVYRLTFPHTPEASLDVHWLVGWNQVRELRLEHPVYHWTSIAQAGASGAAILLLLLVVVLLKRRRRTWS